MAKQFQFPSYSNAFRCSECGRILSVKSESDDISGTCRECAEWLEGIGASETHVSWELDYYRENFPELTLDRPTLDWLRQNY